MLYEQVIELTGHWLNPKLFEIYSMQVYINIALLCNRIYMQRMQEQFLLQSTATVAIYNYNAAITATIAL